MEGAVDKGVRAMKDRIEGTPVQRQITTVVDDISRLTDEELEAELQRFRGEAGWLSKAPP